MAIILCMTVLTVTAFAAESGDSETEAEGTDFVIDLGDLGLSEDMDLDSLLGLFGDMIESGEITASDGMPLTPGGNLTLIDDILQIGGKEAETEDLPEKQFITLQSKNGNYFYLVIDRSGETENVYFMNLVDEADLMSLIEEAKGESETTVGTEPAKCSCEDKCELGAVNGKCELCRMSLAECIGKEVSADTGVDKDADSGKSDGSSVAIVVILVLAIAAGVGVYFFKFRKPKDGKNVPNSDDYDYDEDDSEGDEAEPDDADEADETGDTDEDGENE